MSCSEHERALRGDVGVEGIELGPRPHDFARRFGRGILSLSQAPRDLVDLVARFVDHALRHGGAHAPVVLLGLAEEREALASERVEPADALLDSFEAERDARARSTASERWSASKSSMRRR